MNWSIFTKTKKLMTHYAFSINHRGLPVTDSVRQEQSFHNILCETKERSRRDLSFSTSCCACWFVYSCPAKKKKIEKENTRKRKRKGVNVTSTIDRAQTLDFWGGSAKPKVNLFKMAAAWLCFGELFLTQPFRKPRFLDFRILKTNLYCLL